MRRLESFRPRVRVASDHDVHSRRPTRCGERGRAPEVKFAVAAVGLVALLAPARAGLAVHYAPAENLERIDVALIDTAKSEIDIAAYVLTDWPVIDALTRAADRGVKLRIYLDGGQLAAREPPKAFRDLADTPEVQIRTKLNQGVFMHLKSYEIDGRVLRTGAANFSASGEKRQDNDLIVIENAEAAAAFRREFDAIFADGEALAGWAQDPHD
jgi:phosphatidylserine/phosphatidylglycerophosphate/cardiolipin synthase-like enzyme